MDIKELQQHIRTLATLEVPEALLMSCYLNVEAGVQSCRNAFSERVAILRRSIGTQYAEAFEQGLARIVSFIKDDLLPGSKGVAAFARGGDQPFFLSLQFGVPLPTSIAVGNTPNIYHLVELKGTYHRYVIMLCTEERIRIVEVNLGAVTAEVWKERPELRERVGRAWTKQHYQSHRREGTNRFLKEMIGIVDQRMSAGGFTHLIPAGKPVIARLNGLAVGGGNESQLACDLAVMGEHTFIAQVGTGVGSVACGGSTQWLPIHVGDRRARGILFLNQRYPAYTSLAMGLVNIVVPTVKGPDGEFVTRFAGDRTFLSDWNTDPWEQPFEQRATPEDIKKAQKGADGFSIDLSRMDGVLADLCDQIVNKFSECTRYTKAQVNYWKDAAWHATVSVAAATRVRPPWRRARWIAMLVIGI